MHLVMVKKIFQKQTKKKDDIAGTAKIGLRTDQHVIKNLEGQWWIIIFKK